PSGSTRFPYTTLFRSRSIDAFNLHQALNECGDLLVRYGGHALAAGLTINADQVAAFRRRFNDIAKSRVAVDLLVPEHRVDIEVRSEEHTSELQSREKL